MSLKRIGLFTAAALSSALLGVTAAQAGCCGGWGGGWGWGGWGGYGGYGGGCGCGMSYTYVPVYTMPQPVYVMPSAPQIVQVTPPPVVVEVAQPQVIVQGAAAGLNPYYMVNQGPYYSGPGPDISQPVYYPNQMVRPYPYMHGAKWWRRHYGHHRPYVMRRAY